MLEDNNFVSFNKIYDYVKMFCEKKDVSLPVERTVRSWLDNRNKKQKIKVIKSGFKYDFGSSVKMLKLDHNMDITSTMPIVETIKFSNDTLMYKVDNAKQKYQKEDEYKKKIDDKIFKIKSEIFMNVFLKQCGLEFNENNIFNEAILRDSDPELFKNAELEVKSLTKKASDN